jgi:hypothetical protein
MAGRYKATSRRKGGQMGIALDQDRIKIILSIIELESI